MHANADQYNVKAGDQFSIQDPIKIEKISSTRVMFEPKYRRSFECSQNRILCQLSLF
ncbi:unnamed protein product [Paramecium sonneborni]|uniref:Uncharacterized protein n=1 Tax=Paramecium sonneborni TaxID=65129 RepID=A0A8S1RNY5_9CILI|nr:unnamed protein product [Paramecium sonneborni]